MRRRLLASSLIVLVLGIAGGASSAMAASVDTAPPEAPAPTEPAPVEPAPETSVADTVPPEEDDGTDWIPIVLIVLGGALLIAVVVALVTRNPRTSSSSAAQPQQRAASSVQSNLLSTAQWIHDQLSLELLAAAPVAAQQRWLTDRSRLDDVVIGAQQQWAEGHGTGWQQLGQVLSSLATAIDTNIHLRVQPTTDASLIAESNDVVNRQRGTLQQVLTALWAVTPR